MRGICQPAESGLRRISSGHHAPSHRTTTIMVDTHEHGACVNAWMDRAAKGLPPERLLQVFEQGFTALWGRANRTLGDVTLMAIVDRVLCVATGRYPFLASLQVDAAGLRCNEFRKHVRGLPRDELEKAVGFVLVEFLTVLGNLTAEILTPALHSELSKITSEQGRPHESKSQDRPPDSESKAGEEAKS